jgi:NAD(P)-dependent dehydrogenase (short-subunit alcohol dehydrogenase family)
MRLNGKTCLVTGAAGGIGSALTKLFLSQGAQVIATDLDLAALETKFADAKTDTLHLRALDITDPTAIAALNDSLEAASAPCSTPRPKTSISSTG